MFVVVADVVAVVVAVVDVADVVHPKLLWEMFAVVVVVVDAVLMLC